MVDINVIILSSSLIGIDINKGVVRYNGQSMYLSSLDVD